MPRLSQVLQGIKITQAGKRTEGTRQTRLPVTPDVLLRIKTAWEKETINDDRVMLWAAFTLCFFSFMGSGEIGANSESDFDPTRNLTTQDVAIDNLTNPQILKICLKCSKTDPFREGSDIFLARIPMTNYAQSRLCWLG